MDDTTKTVSFRHKRIDRHIKRDCGIIHRSFSNLKWGMRWESRHYLQFSTKMLFRLIAIHKKVAFLEGRNISNKSHFAEDPVTSKRQSKQTKNQYKSIFGDCIFHIAVIWPVFFFSSLISSLSFFNITHLLLLSMVSNFKFSRIFVCIRICVPLHLCAFIMVSLSFLLFVCLCALSFFVCHSCLPDCCLKRQRKIGLELEGWKDSEDQLGDERGKSLIRIYCIKGACYYFFKTRIKIKIFITWV